MLYDPDLAKARDSHSRMGYQNAILDLGALDRVISGLDECHLPSDEL